MALIKRIEKTNNLYQTWIEISPAHCEILWADHEMTEDEAQAFMNAYLDAHMYDDVPHQELSIYDTKETIENAVEFIKTSESLTLMDWNDYLATLSLADKYAVRWFVIEMANRLAEMNEIDIDGVGELLILFRMKTWLINTPVRRIKKIFYGER